MKDTNVIAFVKLAWNEGGGNPWSWEMLNRVVYETCHIAAKSFEWNSGDMQELSELANRRYSIHKCLGENGVEWLYSTAVKAANMSACVELEGWLGRAPIIADGANGRQRDRIAMGSRFTYGIEPGESGVLEVTSFNAKGQAVCVPYDRGKRRRLFRIGPDDIKRDRKARKDAASK